ncbi:MAG: hypothetical protein DRI77_05175 [Chloroflexi bacterium]|nr:MAG: hypothetical protein DRI77_05175 [Chloroflexota bacterium]
MKTKNILIIILLLFVACGAIYSVVVPPFEASDEKWHYPMVKYMADNGALPVQEPGVETAWRQEGSQPPLYYFVAALATCWIDTSDMGAVRHLNPHVDPGATPDGNVNLVVHDPALETFPWRGTVLAVHLIRFLSVLMGAAAVYLTYLIARELLPDRPALALGAAAIHALTPMYIFISASVNNDALVVPLCSLALLMLIKLASGKYASGQVGKFASRCVVLGVVLGLAALTKTSSLPLTVLTALVVVARALRRRSWREFIVGGLATLLPFLSIAGWWFWRNLQLYGDIFGLDTFIEILGQRDVPADLAQLWRERYSFAAGYWGNFGGLNVPLPAWAYTALNTLAVVAGFGFLLFLFRAYAPLLPSAHPLPRPSASLLLCFLWGLGVLVSWANWASITWSSQGRLVFSAIQTWSLLLALGIAAWFPRRWGGWAMASFALFLLILAALAPWLWIRPAYALPEPLTGAQIAAIPNPLDDDFGATMRLLGYDLPTEAVEPGGQVEVTLYWESLAPTDRDHTVFVHLLGEGDLPVAQRDTFPGLGLLSTTWLEPGYTWADRYVIQLPETAYAPDLAQIEVGLYDGASGERLPVGSGDNVRFGRIEVRPRSGDVPNPIMVNFGDKMALVGYDLDRRSLRAGETVTLTLYWRGLREMDANYTISTQLIDPAQVKAAQHDSWPADGAAPTTIWEPGRLVTDIHTLAVGDVPSGVYDVQVVVYVQEGEEFVHLPVISQKGEMLSSHILLTRVRVQPWVSVKFLRRVVNLAWERGRPRPHAAKMAALQ